MCLMYLKGTNHMKPTIRNNSLSILKWWVDVSYNKHDNCKGHNGAIMTLGKGTVIGMSNKKKSNVKISIEG